MDTPTLQFHLSILFFSFTSLFLLFSLALNRLLKPNGRAWWCNCPTCHAYVTSSWSSDHANLSDWYTHLLRLSPSRTINIHVLGNIVTANPLNVEHILKTNFNSYPKGPAFSAILSDFLGHGIFNVDADHWRFQRKLSSAELGASSVRMFAFRVVSDEARRRLIPLLRKSDEKNSVLDLQDVFRRFAFDNICKVSFGLDPGCLDLSLPMSEFAAAFDRASWLSACRATATVPAVWKVKRMLNLGSERELKEAIHVVDVLARDVIRERRKLGFSGNQDLLSRFMSCVDDDKMLRDIVVSFILAGRDTIASALTCFFMLLARNEEAAVAVKKEVDKFMGWGGEKYRDDQSVSYEQLRRMNYLHAAVHESLRLYPPVQFDSKFCVEDDVLPDGTFVDRGTRVTYHPYAMGRMEELWGSDAAEFRPERWLRDGVFVPESPFKFPVFQGGPRVCLGKEMALVEMKAVIVAVVRRFDIEVVERMDGSPRFAPGLTASLREGLPVRVRRRV